MSDTKGSFMKSVHKFLLIFFSVFFGFIVLVIFLFTNIHFDRAPSQNKGYNASSTSNVTRASNETTTAMVMCQDVIEKNMHNPASADFQGVFDGLQPATYQGIINGMHTYNHQSWVDGNNGFGAKIRTHYICTIATKDFNNWQVIHLQTK